MTPADSTNNPNSPKNRLVTNSLCAMLNGAPV